jgi:hypothetical protein
MQDIARYFFLINMAILFVLVMRTIYLQFKLIKYLRRNHPEKTKDFGCPLGGWINGFKFGNALYKKHDIEDPDFVCLKNKAKNAQTLAILSIFPSLLFLLLLLIIGIVL